MIDGSANLIGVFPGFARSGGVQKSGAVAWEGITRTAEAGGWTAWLFCYGDDPGGPVPNTAAVCARSRLDALANALRMHSNVQRVLVWHLGLLRLIPLFRLRRARVFTFLHGIEAWQPHDWLTGYLLRRCITGVLTNSDHTWRRFAAAHRHLQHLPHTTVHLGLDGPVDGAVPLPVPPPAALMVSRLLRSEDYKGHRELLAAWPAVAQRIPGAQLWIAGDGDLRADLERTVRASGLDSLVRFFGYVSESQKQELLAKCRCLAMPSRAEGFGLVYLEAMRMGRPCLVSTLDAGREVINPPEAGLAADPSDGGQLVDAVCRLLTPGMEWDGWSAQARDRYARLFTATCFHRRLNAALK